MTPDQINALIAGAVTLATAIGLPTYLKVRRPGITQMFRDERDRLQKRLDEMDTKHASELAAVQDRSARALADAELAWQKQHDIDQVKISLLRDEIDNLYRQIHQVPPTR